MPRQRLMTAEEFERFMRDRNRLLQIVVQPPYELQECTCGDVNCHGWRFVARRREATSPVAEAVHA